MVSPTPVSDLSLDQIRLSRRFSRDQDTVEIAERFKFFKRMQQDKEGVAEYLAELRKLGNYLEKASS